MLADTWFLINRADYGQRETVWKYQAQIPKEKGSEQIRPNYTVLKKKNLNSREKSLTLDYKQKYKLSFLNDKNEN